MRLEQDWRKREHGRRWPWCARPAPPRWPPWCRPAPRRAAIVPQGGNTGLVGGAPPRRQRHAGAAEPAAHERGARHRRRQPDHDGGSRLHAAEPAGGGASAGFLFPLSLAAEGSCTIGGNLATNAGGTQVLRYGNARELCLGLEVVTAQGEVWEGLSGLRKDNTGYDLRDLFIGSEGTLGIITAATLKLYPLPAATLTAWAAVPSLDAAVALLGLAHQHLGGPDRL
jgi:FAD/FMN-containing dehydrogenase